MLDSGYGNWPRSHRSQVSSSEARGSGVGWTHCSPCLSKQISGSGVSSAFCCSRLEQLVVALSSAGKYICYLPKGHSVVSYRIHDAWHLA